MTKGETGRGQGKQKVACNVWEDRSAGGVSVSTRNGAPSRKRCGANGQMTSVRQATNEYALPPPPPPLQVSRHTGDRQGFVCQEEY